MQLNSQDLEKIADLTLDYYNRHAEDFWEGTRNHDVSQNIAAMLQYIESERPFTILDFGCGPPSLDNRNVSALYQQLGVSVLAAHMPAWSQP
jgi:hypothetical protein